jgi:hypothetical protein
LTVKTRQTAHRLDAVKLHTAYMFKSIKRHTQQPVDVIALGHGQFVALALQVEFEFIGNPGLNPVCAFATREGSGKCGVFRVIHLGHLLFGALFVQRDDGLPERMARLGGFTSGQVTDGCLSASASGCNLGLCDPPGLEFGNDVFPVHGLEYIGKPVFLQQAKRYGKNIECLYV